MSLYVHWPEGAQRESDITDYDAYYERLRTRADLPTTSQPSIGDFLAVYEPLLDAGHEIVSIHLAGGMSGTVRRRRAGARAARRPGRRGSTWSTRPTACGGEGLVRAGGGRRGAQRRRRRRGRRARPRARGRS